MVSAGNRAFSRLQTQRTIEDFGRQWTRFTTNDGYYASLELFRDICGPLLDTNALRGASVAEIGSGTGRIVAMLAAAGAGHIIAVEPSDAFFVLLQNTGEWADRIDYVHGPGEAIPADHTLDYVFAIGVLHHIYDPVPVVRAAYQALRPGGRMLIWVYGREGNEKYLAILRPLRQITQKVPEPLLTGICHILNIVLDVYLPLCRILPLPLRSYMVNVIGRFSRARRHLVIYDQLNPTTARYYTKSEAETLLAAGGFTNIQLHRRHGYSWSVIGEKRRA